VFVFSLSTSEQCGAVFGGMCWLAGLMGKRYHRLFVILLCFIMNRLYLYQHICGSYISWKTSMYIFVLSRR
jgi:hypothetical protein